MALELRHQQFGQFPDAGLPVGVAMLKICPLQRSVPVFDDPEEALHAVLHVGEAALLKAAVDELNGGPLDEVEDQLRDRARAADAGRIQAVQPRPDQLNGGRG